MGARDVLFTCKGEHHGVHPLQPSRRPTNEIASGLPPRSPRCPPTTLSVVGCEFRGLGEM